MATTAISMQSALHRFEYSPWPMSFCRAFGFKNLQLQSKLSSTISSIVSNTESKAKKLKQNALYGDNDDEGYLVDAPVSVGDGFSFSGGKYSDLPSKAEEWFKQGKIIKAYSIDGGAMKAKDPFFGLTMGEASQIQGENFRWFYVEVGDASNPTIVLIHGFPSQAYSFRKVFPILSKDYHIIAFDWLGFGFSDKPQPKYGFDYTMDDYRLSLESLVDVLGLKNVTLVAQGYFAPVVVKYAKSHQENVNNLILINSPLTEQHAKLPSALLSFASFLLGEIFAQDPLRASDKLLTNCGPYLMDEEDAMVYRRPYLTSGSAGFALTEISRILKKELKGSIGEMRSMLCNEGWQVPTTILWGMRDRWLNYSGVEEFAKSAGHQLIQLPKRIDHLPLIMGIYEWSTDIKTSKANTVQHSSKDAMTMEQRISSMRTGLAIMPKRTMGKKLVKLLRGF